MTVAEVVVAPAVPYAAGLLLLLTCLVLLALGQAWNSTLGWLFNKLADLLDKVSFAGHHLLGPVSSGLRAVSHNVWVAINAAALACEKSAQWMFHQAGTMMREIGESIAALAGDTSTTITRIVTVDVPNAAHAATIPLANRLHGIDRLPARIEAQVAGKLAAARHGIDRIVDNALGKLRTAVRGIDATIQNALKTTRGLTRRISRVEKKLGAATFAALVAGALARLGLRWLRCRNVKKTLPRVCSMDTDLFESLLASTLLLTSALSLRQMARELEEPTALIRDGLTALVRELP